MPDDLESLLHLCLEIKGLASAEHLAMETRLAAVDRAMTLAVGDTVESARDFVRDVVLGRLED